MPVQTAAIESTHCTFSAEAAWQEKRLLYESVLAKADSNGSHMTGPDHMTRGRVRGTALIVGITGVIINGPPPLPLQKMSPYWAGAFTEVIEYSKACWQELMK